MICQKCGTNNIEGASICKNCGNSLGINAESNNETFNINESNTNSNIQNNQNIAMSDQTLYNNQPTISVQPEVNETMVQQPSPTINQPINTQPEDNASMDQISSPIINQPIDNSISQQSNPVYNENSNINQNIQQANIGVTNSQNTNKKKMLIISIIVIILAIGGFIIFKHLTKTNVLTSNKSTQMIEASCIQNKKYIYALFDKSGKQLTDFNLKSCGDIINGASVVKNTDDQYGIISSKGKMIVDFNKYSYILSAGGLYEASDSDYDYLLDSKGKVLLKEESLSISDMDTIALVEKENKYYVYGGSGNVITSFNKSSNDDIDDPDYSEDEGGYIIVFYNNKNYLIDSNKEKLLLTFDDKQCFCVSDINKTANDEITISSCSDWYSDVDSNVYKYIKKGKVVYTKTSEQDGGLTFRGNNVQYYDGNKYYILDSKGNVAFEANDRVSYMSNNEYAIVKTNSEGMKITRKDGSTSVVEHKWYINNTTMYSAGVEIHNNGKIVKTLLCTNVDDGGKNTKNKTYLLSGCGENGTSIFYDAKGNQMGDEYHYATNYDENGIALVGDNEKEQYMINLKGEKLSGIYTFFYHDEGTKYYIGFKDDKKQDLLYEDGTVIASGSHVNLFPTYDYHYGYVEKDKQYSVYDLKSKKLIVTVNSVPNFEATYFQTSSDSKKEYYAYETGKKFYEQ